MLYTPPQLYFVGATAPTSAVEGAQWFDTTNDLLKVYSGTFWMQTTPEIAEVAASEIRSLTTYGDLTTPGPAVTLDTGTKVMVSIGAFATSETPYVAVNMSFAISGATTLASSDANSVSWYNETGFTEMRHSNLVYQTVTAGTNTFTAKYKGEAASVSWSDRTIAVWPLPF